MQAGGRSQGKQETGHKASRWQVRYPCDHYTRQVNYPGDGGAGRKQVRGYRCWRGSQCYVRKPGVYQSDMKQLQDPEMQ